MEKFHSYWLKRFGIVLASAVLVVPLMVLQASPVEAAPRVGNVYVVVNNSVCVTPGVQVRGIMYNSLQTGDTSRWWDNGDNIVYPKVRFNQRNRITLQVRCEKRSYGFFWVPVGYRTVTADIRPTAWNQTFWVR